MPDVLERELDIVNARPQMLEMLDGMRDMLEDLGGNLGVTDPVSGETVAKLAARTPSRKVPCEPGLGLVACFQEVPFQCRMMDLSKEPL